MKNSIFHNFSSKTPAYVYDAKSIVNILNSINIGISCFIWGITALIVTLQPILTNALAGPILGEKVTWKQWVGIIFGFFGAKIFARITLVPNKILWPMIFAVSVCGTYSLSQSIIDVWIMLFFGVIGFFMRRYGFSVVPVIIGLILGELVEGTLRQSLVIFDGNWLMFLTRPIAITFFVLSIIALTFPLFKKKTKV